jgi:hypothetical protein
MTLAQNLAAYSEWRSELSSRLASFSGWLVENELDRRPDRSTNLAIARQTARRSPACGLRRRVLARQVGVDQRHLFCRLRQSHSALDRRSHDDVPDRADVRRQSRRRSNCCRSAAANPTPVSASTSAFPTSGPSCRSTPLRRGPCRRRFGMSAKSSASTARTPKASASAIVDGDTAVFRVDRMARRDSALAACDHQFPAPAAAAGAGHSRHAGSERDRYRARADLVAAPNAHAVLFILAADTGCHAVRSDGLARAHRHAGGRKKGRIVVLNKIDSLWDELKSARKSTPKYADRSIPARGRWNLPENQIFPVSAQKALVAKINGDDALLERSRLSDLERALRRADPGQAGNRSRQYRQRVRRLLPAHAQPARIAP